MLCGIALGTAIPSRIWGDTIRSRVAADLCALLDLASAVGPESWKRIGESSAIRWRAVERDSETWRGEIHRRAQNRTAEGTILLCCRARSGFAVRFVRVRASFRSCAEHVPRHRKPTLSLAVATSCVSHPEAQRSLEALVPCTGQHPGAKQCEACGRRNLANAVRFPFALREIAMTAGSFSRWPPGRCVGLRPMR